MRRMAAAARAAASGAAPPALFAAVAWQFVSGLERTRRGREDRIPARFERQRAARRAAERHLRDRKAHRPRRHGRGLQGLQHPDQRPRRDQDDPTGAFAQSRRFGAVPARGFHPAQSPARSDRALFRLFRRPRSAARLSGDGIRRRSVADQAARLGTAPARRRQDPAEAHRRRARSGASSGRRPPRHFLGQRHSARWRRAARQDHRFRHRALASAGRGHDHRRWFRRQVQLCLARAGRPRRRRGHVQVGHIQLRPRSRGGVARAADRHERLAGRRHREAPRRSRSFRRRRFDAAAHSGDAATLAGEPPAEHGGGRRLGRDRRRRSREGVRARRAAGAAAARLVRRARGGDRGRADRDRQRRRRDLRLSRRRRAMVQIGAVAVWPRPRRRVRPRPSCRLWAPNRRRRRRRRRRRPRTAPKRPRPRRPRPLRPPRRLRRRPRAFPRART